MAFDSTTNAAVALGVSFVLAWLWSMLNWVWFKPKRLEKLFKDQGIHGNSYRVFYGDLKDIKAMRAQARALPMATFSHDYIPRVRPFLHRTIEQYGKNCLMWEGPNPVMNIGEVELVKEVFVKYNEFQKPRLNPISHKLVLGLFSYEGHKWVQQRKLLNPAFHMEKLKLMQPAFYTSCSEMVNLWEEKLSKSEKEIDIYDHLTKLSADTISRAAFGSSYEEGQRIFELIKEQFIVVNEINQSVYFPGLRFLPTENNRKMSAIDREIKTLLTGIIEKRKEEKETRDDLLGLLMGSNLQRGNDKKYKVKITTQEMIDECKLFYLAGQETTSSLLIWTIILLSKHQDWQSKAREEVLEVFGHNKPDFDGLGHLKTISLIFYEVLRLYPPALELRRMVVGDNTKLGNLTLPSGTLINLPIHYIHQDHEVWGDDAKEFNPGRFAQGIERHRLRKERSATNMASGRGSSSREGTAKAAVSEQISQAILSTSNLLILMQQSSPSQARLAKLPRNLFEKTDTIRNTGQVLEQLPLVISSLDAHIESGLHSAPRLKTVIQLLGNMESSHLNSFSEAQPDGSSKNVVGSTQETA